MKDTRELRAYLIEQMLGVTDGKVSLAEAKGVGYLAQQVYNTLNVEIKMAVARAKLDGEKEIEPVNFN